MTEQREEMPVLIENWSLFFDPTRPNKVYLHGNFFGHPTVKNGEEATTSQVLDYNAEKGIFICVSRNYRLGEVDRYYGEKHPNPLKKVLEAIQHD